MPSAQELAGEKSAVARAASRSASALSFTDVAIRPRMLLASPDELLRSPLGTNLAYWRDHLGEQACFTWAEGSPATNSNCSAYPRTAQARPRVQGLKGELPCCEFGQR